MKQPAAPHSILVLLDPRHDVNCQLLCRFSAPVSIISLLLQVYKNMCKCSSVRRELGGVKPHVYPKRFSSFGRYFLFYLALYWMPPLALLI